MDKFLDEVIKMMGDLQALEEEEFLEEEVFPPHDTWTCLDCGATQNGWDSCYQCGAN